MNCIELLFALLVAHALADYAWQGDFMAAAKNRAKPIPGVPFYQPLISHSVIHGGFVALILLNPWLGLAEAIAHGLIDDAKCTGKISFNADQALHVACKILWLAIAILVPGLW
ncbi:DUF3307 domain-containing protein [Sphingomonas sp. LaA6.9]|uniref:DUF3307 domain-containing protein n=1 Tax=Sphingomonas sp. LaA6.9 TaxID=2919914 RepID=UPI001F501D59|nr:DUF3307 domain-containing protein [Sphingomonas sp. LaA6.9]MCJ8158841.1 DUF3307 domain-containing protein [Sphingomonas sp. LaA6.9]